MKTQFTILFLLLSTTVVYSNTVELPLACEGLYFKDPDLYWGNWYWENDFNFEVTFQEITSISIDWRGEITSGLYLYEGKLIHPNLQIEIALHDPSESIYLIGFIFMSGGDTTYPEPESFDCLTEFWMNKKYLLLDGQGCITFHFDFYPPPPESEIIERGFVLLHEASLIFEGTTIVPEPTTLLLLSLGVLFLKNSKKKQK